MTEENLRVAANAGLFDTEFLATLSWQQFVIAPCAAERTQLLPSHGQCIKNPKLFLSKTPQNCLRLQLKLGVAFVQSAAHKFYLLLNSYQV